FRFDGLLDGQQRLPHQGLQFPGAIGGGHAVAGAHQERIVEQIPEALEAIAHGRLAEAQLLGGTGHVALPQQYVEVDQQIEVDPVYIHTMNTLNKKNKLGKSCHGSQTARNLSGSPITNHQGSTTMTSYANEIAILTKLRQLRGSGWDAINPESAARMRVQNQFRTGLDIARYTADIMRRDMAAYDADCGAYTQSLGCWHGFIGQQKLISIKKHFGTTDKRYLYLSGWMIAALRSEFGPLPDQSMHEKTAVPALIEELYTFLRQADAWELNHLFRELDAARDAGNQIAEKAALNRIENFETHVVPIIAAIDAGFGNAEATYLLAKKMIEAGACCIQLENQVSDEKQCGHQ